MAKDLLMDKVSHRWQDPLKPGNGSWMHQGFLWDHLSFRRLKSVQHNISTPCLGSSPLQLLGEWWWWMASLSVERRWLAQWADSAPECEKWRVLGGSGASVLVWIPQGMNSVLDPNTLLCSAAWRVAKGRNMMESDCRCEGCDLAGHWEDILCKCYQGFLNWNTQPSCHLSSVSSHWWPCTNRPGMNGALILQNIINRKPSKEYVKAAWL